MRKQGTVGNPSYGDIARIGQRSERWGGSHLGVGYIGRMVGHNSLGVGSWTYVWTHGLKMVGWMNCWTGSWPGVIKHYEYVNCWM